MSFFGLFGKDNKKKKKKKKKKIRRKSCQEYEKNK